MMMETQENMPFHVLRTSGEFVAGFRHFFAAEEYMKMRNRWALDNGRSERYIANEVDAPDTFQESN